jgi:hypothetical protein
MKKSIPFELFGPNQYIMFDIQRLAELERALGRDITSIVRSQYAGVDFCLAALPIGMRQHYKAAPSVFAEKIEAYLENGGTLDDIALPIIKAIVASGILGKEMNDRLNESSEPEGGEGKNVKEETE